MSAAAGDTDDRTTDHTDELNLDALLSPGFHSYELRGAGGYGAVVSPAFPNGGRSFPGNVTKLFFKKSAFDEARVAVAKIREILGKENENAGHRVNLYETPYTVANLPPSISLALHGHLKESAPESPLYMFRMPDLGVDLHKVDHDREYVRMLRQLPFRTVLLQMRKLVRQVAAIAAAGYGHFDVRAANIMVNPTTGNMTLVDFDWLLPFAELRREYPFGFFSNPPEALFLRSIVSGAAGTAAQIRKLFRESPTYSLLLRQYVKDNLWYHGNALQQAGFAVTEEAFAEAVTAVNVENMMFLQGGGADRVTERSLKTFDSYGLGLALLEFLSLVYPHASGRLELTHDTLASRVKHTDADELLEIASTVLQLSLLFQKMTRQRVEMRISAAAAASQMDWITRIFDEETGGSDRNSAAAVGGAGAASVAGTVSHAGGSRKTRARTTRKTKHRNRNQNRKRHTSKR